MRILACVHEPPVEPLNGFGLQVTGIFDRLAVRHDVRAITYESARGPVARRDYLSFVARPDGGALAGAARWARSGRPRRSDELAAGMRAEVRETIAAWHPDVVHVTSGRLASLGPDLTGVPSVLAALDAWHLNVAAKAALAGPARRAALAVEERRVRAFIRDEYPAFDRVTVVSAEDADALRTVAPGLSPVVIPNGVDTHAFARDERTGREPGAVVFSGAMDYPPNEAAAVFLAREVMPAVWEAVPAARLYLVGRSPSGAVTALSSERVTVTGEVAEMPPWLSRAAVYACPMVSGTGIKNKLLEALACAAPVVCTPLALQGLSAVAGDDLLVGDDAAALGSAITRLLSDEVLADRLGASGRRYVVEHHSWDAAARAYERLYEEISATV